MRQQVRCFCSNTDRCGFQGRAIVGWVKAPPEVIAKLAAEGFAVSEAGDRVRIRLRRLPCPKCGQRSLARLDRNVGDTIERLSKALVAPS